MILHAVVVPCDYHVTFREKILFFTKSICKNSINCQSFKNFEGKERKGRRGKGGEEKGGKRRKKWGGRREEEGGEGRRKGTELRKMQVVTYDCHGDIV